MPLVKRKGVAKARVCYWTSRQNRAAARTIDLVWLSCRFPQQFPTRSLGKGVGKSTSTLRYTTTEYDEFSNILVRGVNTLFTSVDRITINKTDTGCEVIYDATLTANWIITPMNIVLGKVFNKIGDTATRGLREVLA